MNTITLSEFARRNKVSVAAVSQAIKRGRLVECVHRNPSTGQVSGVDPDIATREWSANLDVAKRPVSIPGTQRGRPRSDGSYAPSPPPREHEVNDNGELESPAASFARHRSEKERYAAALAKLEYEKAVGVVVDATEITEAWVRLITEAKTKFLALPSQAKAQIPHLTKSDVRLLEDLARQALESMAAWQLPEQ